MIRVLIVSDIRLYRDGVHPLLAASGRIEVVAAVPDVQAGVRIAQAASPHVVVVHVVSQEGPAAVRALSAGSPSAEIVVLALRDDLCEEVISYALAGATGYLPLEGSLDDLIATIEGVVRGEAAVSPLVAGALLRQIHMVTADGRPSDLSQLTCREVDVVDLLAQGLTNKEISRRLGISPATVKNHVHAILKKVGLSRRGEVAAWASVHLSERLSQLRATRVPQLVDQGRVSRLV